MLESEFKAALQFELRDRFPNCFLYKLDPNQRQGIPDLLILWHDRWGCLETKRGVTSTKQPNQEYFIDMFNKMSFAAFINPINYLDVLYDMERAFKE